MKQLQNAFRCLLLALVCCSAAIASEQQDAEWHYMVSSYSWMSSITGDVTVKDTTAHVSIPFSKVIDYLNFAGEMHLEANKGPWTLMLDPIYVHTSVGVTAGPVFVGPMNETVVGPIDIDVRTQLLIVDSGLFYQAYQTETANHQHFSAEVLGGVRYFGLKNRLTLRPNDTEIFSDVVVSGHTSVAAPIIGARIKHQIVNTELWCRGDIGGFDIDHVKQTWEVTAGVAYRVSQHVDLGAAYRVLKINIHQSSDNAFKTRLYGPELGIAIHY